MSNIYEYKDYKTLLGDITSGNYVIHQPISVDNEPISFLGNLLNYSNIDKTNIHKILVSILNKIKTELFKQHLKKSGTTMLKHVQGEWSDNEDIKDKEVFCDHDCGCLDNVQQHMINKNEYEKFINELEDKFSEQKVYSKMLPEHELEDYSVLELSNSIEDINNKCKMIIDQLDRDLNLINAEKYKIENIDLSLLLDLSMKHINLYQQLNTDTNQTEISPNIHNLYMNYTLVINLLKKQVNHIRNIIINLKKEVEDKCNNMKELLNNTSSSNVISE